MTDLSADRLSELWGDERCAWRLEFEEASYTSSGAWRLNLEWTQEFGTPHLADWATYTWQFYADTADEAVADAVKWCEELLPFERCGTCDGEGKFGALDNTKTCEDCEGTGLANRPEPATAGGA